jgi:hypothetical protein
MTLTIAKENLEQYFSLYKKSNTSGIKKTKSLLEQLRTWARNSCTKKKSAKAFRNFPEVQQQFMGIFDAKHEKVIAFNVTLALFRMGVIKFDGPNANSFIHDSSLTDKAIRIITGMQEDNKKERVLA